MKMKCFGQMVWLYDKVSNFIITQETAKYSVMPLSCGRTVNNSRPFPIVLVKCWKVAHWNAKNCYLNFKSCDLNFLMFLSKR